MRNRRDDVVAAALDVLDRWGLADLSVRRLAGELGVQPSALYHHFASKQLLLAAVAEEILRRAPPRPRPRAWDGRARAVCQELRDGVLAVRDGAEVVATVHAFGLGARGPRQELRDVLADAGCPPALAEIGASTLWHFVLGHAADEQTHLQAGSAGAIGDEPPSPGTGVPPGVGVPPEVGVPPGAGGDFELGLELVLAGIAAQRTRPATAVCTTR